MNEFIKKLIERLEEISVENTCSDCPYKSKCDEVQESINDETTDLCGATIKALAISIVNQLAEEYNECYEDCGQCEAYDNEKYHCPKFCKVITEAVAEIEENHNNDFCEWKEIFVGGITAVKEPHRMKLFNHDNKQKFCPYCGKKIKVVE